MSGSSEMTCRWKYADLFLDTRIRFSKYTSLETVRKELGKCEAGRPIRLEITDGGWGGEFPQPALAMAYLSELINGRNVQVHAFGGDSSWVRVCQIEGFETVRVYEKPEKSEKFLGSVPNGSIVYKGGSIVHRGCDDPDGFIRIFYFPSKLVGWISVNNIFQVVTAAEIVSKVKCKWMHTDTLDTLSWVKFGEHTAQYNVPQWSKELAPGEVIEQLRTSLAKASQPVHIATNVSGMESLKFDTIADAIEFLEGISADGEPIPEISFDESDRRLLSVDLGQMVRACNKGEVCWVEGYVTSMTPLEVDGTAYDQALPVASVASVAFVPVSDAPPAVSGSRSAAIGDRMRHKKTLSLGLLKAIQSDGTALVVMDGATKLERGSWDDFNTVQALCIQCNSWSSMVWSDHAAGVFNTDCKCDKCRQDLHQAGQYRWKCQQCKTHVCGKCAIMLDQSAIGPILPSQAQFWGP